MGQKLLCSTRFPSIIAAIGALPLYVYLYFLPINKIPIVYAQFYVCLILSFISGINWLMALQRNSPLLLIWSIVVLASSLIILLLNQWGLITSTEVWCGLLLLLWLALAQDFFNRHQAGLDYFFCARRSGTIFISIAILLLIWRLN